MSFAVLLFVFTALIFQERTFELSTLEWVGIAMGFLGIAHLNIPASRWTDLFLKAGIAGFLSSMLMGTLDQDLPISLVLYGAGSGTFAYLCADLFRHYLRQTENILPAIAALLVGLLGGWWTYALADVLDVEWTAGGIEVLVPLIFITMAIAVTLMDKELVEIGFVPSVGLIIIALGLQVTAGVLTVMGLAIGLLIVMVLSLMVWYTMMNMPRTTTIADKDIHRPLQRGLLWSVMIATGFFIGWVLRDTGIVGVIFVGGFGLLWLPIVSSLLGFRAFVQLADEEII
jgi:hypothetical protein